MQPSMPPEAEQIPPSKHTLGQGNEQVSTIANEFSDRENYCRCMIRTGSSVSCNTVISGKKQQQRSLAPIIPSTIFTRARRQKSRTSKLTSEKYSYYRNFCSRETPPSDHDQKFHDDSRNTCFPAHLLQLRKNTKNPLRRGQIEVVR